MEGADKSTELLRHPQGIGFFNDLLVCFFSFEEVSAGQSRDEPVISERDKLELMNLCQENISMDFILEMREAFQLFDKVRFCSVGCRSCCYATPRHSFGQ